MHRGDELPAELWTLADRGLKLFPVHGRGKIPLFSGWRRQATSDTGTLAQWNVAFPGCNWGVATGICSGAFVLDIDGPIGSDSLSRLVAEHGALPDTLSVITGRGKHLYLTTAQAQAIKNRVGFPSKGIDVRGDGGYAVVPPSKHETGTQYRFENSTLEIAASPQWLIRMLARERDASLSKICKGSRNDRLARFAGLLRHRGATRRQLEEALLLENDARCVPPLPNQEVRRIAESIACYPEGGPDVLARAYAAIEGQSYGSTYERVIALFAQLQAMMPGKPVALPLERIAGHLGYDWSLIRRYRQRAETEGLIRKLAPYVYKQKAALFEISDACSQAVPLNQVKAFSSGTPSSGTPLSGTPASRTRRKKR